MRREVLRPTLHPYIRWAIGAGSLLGLLSIAGLELVRGHDDFVVHRWEAEPALVGGGASGGIKLELSTEGCEPGDSWVYNGPVSPTWECR